MKRLYTLLAGLILTGVTFAITPVNSIAMRMEEEPILLSSCYDSTFTVLNNTIQVYIYRKNIVVQANTPPRISYRIKINNRWYDVDEKTFERARSKRLTRRQIKNIQSR